MNHGEVPAFGQALRLSPPSRQYPEYACADVTEASDATRRPSTYSRMPPAPRLAVARCHWPSVYDAGLVTVATRSG